MIDRKEANTETTSNYITINRLNEEVVASTSSFDITIQIRELEKTLRFNRKTSQPE